MTDHKSNVPLPLRPFQWVGASLLGAFQEIGSVSRFTGGVLLASFTPRWYFGEILRQMVRIGFYSLPVVGLSAVFIGAALALNIYVGGARFNAEQFVPAINVVGITRELGPVITGLMLAGRVSAGIAAEIGAMRVTEQIDALTTLSANPNRYLYGPRFIAAVLTLPMLVVVADIIGVAGGWLVGVGNLDFDNIVYLRNTMSSLNTTDVVVGLIKSAAFGAVIALMGCYHGDQSSAGATGVGRAATNAMVSAAILILASNFVLSTLFAGLSL